MFNISEMMQDRAISTKFLTHRLSAKSTGNISRQSFPATFGDILNFCVKFQNAFILVTVRDRAISMQFLTLRLSAESIGDFSQKLFSRHFWVPS